MQRLRVFARLLGCLAVLAAGLPAAALASNAAAKAATSQASEPCSHCPDCDACPDAATIVCAVSCLAAPPALGGARVDLQTAGHRELAWPGRHASLHGQTRPPDPFPPRS